MQSMKKDGMNVTGILITDDQIEESRTPYSRAVSLSSHTRAIQKESSVSSSRSTDGATNDRARQETVVLLK